jgi:diacylglycerol kinase family enzyme
MSRGDRVTIGVVTNPNSKKNRARKGRAAELQRILGARGFVRETASIEEIQPAVREFLERDVRYWVSDGGDGALHWLVNEAREPFQARAMSLPLTVPTNGGTIDFVAKKVGIRGEADEILARLVRFEEEHRPIPVEDVASFVVSGVRVDPAGVERPFERIGFTVAVCGVGQRFFDLYYLDPMPGADTLVRIIAKGVGSIALNAPLVDRIPLLPASWRGYVRHLLKPQLARVRVDGELLAETSWGALHVGAIYVDLAGVVKLFPLAGGGRLNLMIGSPTMPQILANLPQLFSGTPLTHGVTERAVGRVEVEAMGEELLAPCIDGELFRGIRRLKIEPGPPIRVPRVTG